MLPENLPPPTFGTYPGPCSWIRQGQALALAAPFDADRHRLVLTGPRDPGLLACLLATLAAYDPATGPRLLDYLQAYSPQPA